jgi:hypothetical protein
MNSITIKFTYNDEKRIINLPSDQLHHNTLLETFGRLYQKNLSETNFQLKVETKDFDPIDAHLLPQTKENYLRCTVFESGSNVEKLTKEDKIHRKYSNLKNYQKLEIKEDQIEDYKTKLIELHGLGYKRFFFNLKNLVQLREGNDFTKAVEEIKKMEDTRFSKIEQKRDNRRNDATDKKRSYKRNEKNTENKEKNNTENQSSEPVNNGEYTTKAILRREGKKGVHGPMALTAGLEDANLITSVKGPHMTILYLQNGFTEEILEMVNQERIAFMGEKNLFEFYIVAMGKKQ